MVGLGEPLWLPYTGSVSARGVTSEAVYHTRMHLFLEGEEMVWWNITSNPQGRPQGQIMNSGPRICPLCPGSRSNQPVCTHPGLSLHRSPYLMPDPFGDYISPIYDAFRLPNTIHLAMKEYSFVLLPLCMGNCIFDEQSCWPSSQSSLRT